jgi:hypothetical protein
MGPRLALIIYVALFAVAHAMHTVFAAGFREPGGGLIMSLIWTQMFSTAVSIVGYAGGYGFARLAN